MPLARHSLVELRSQRAQAIASARSISDPAEAENRNLNDEEQRQFDQHMADAANLKERIEREERLAAEEAELEEPERRAGRQTEPSQPGGGEQPERRAERRGFLAYRGEPRTLELGDSLDSRAQLDDEWPTEYRGARLDDVTHRELRTVRALILQGIRGSLDSYQRAAYDSEVRHLQADVDILGGELALPPRMAAGILQAADDQTFMRSAGTTIPVGGADGLGIVSLDSDPDDPVWTSELRTGDEDQGMRFGGRELKPNPLAKRLKLSRKLLRVSAIPVENLARRRLGYKVGITLEVASFVGNGVNQPLGIFVASDKGIPTSRDFSDGNTPDELTPDGWKSAKYGLKQQYRRRARAILHRDVVAHTAKWKDEEGRYRLQASLIVGEADRIDGIPVAESEYAPNVMAPGQYVGIVGDLSYYWWADALSMELIRLNEKYQETNQIGLILRVETDGMPVLGEAFSRLLLPNL